MPAYTDHSINKIQVPSASGVLSDEQYSSHSPASYKLDAAIEKHQTILDKLQEDAESFSNIYNNSVNDIAECLGVKFFSINEQALGLVDEEEEINKANTFIDTIITYLEEILTEMTAINGKLDQVESSLKSMNEKYHERQKEIARAQEKYNSHLAQQPIKAAYSEQFEFESYYNVWENTLESLGEKVDSLQKSLEKDITSTKNSITVTWFCKENGGIV